MQDLSLAVNNYKCLRTVVLWAGWLGVLQSAIWIALTTFAILVYNCLISITDALNYGSLLRTVLYDVYFHGSCTPDAYQAYDNTLLKSVSTVLQPDKLFIWICVYLGIAICWLLASVVLLAYFSKDHARKTLVLLLIWNIITCVISAMDLGLFVCFTFDFTRFNAKSYEYNFNAATAGVVDPNAAELLAGSFAAFLLMCISLKGYVLWFINVAILITLIVECIRIIRGDNSDDNNSVTVFTPHKTSDLVSIRAPIHGYEVQKATVYVNDAFVGDNQSIKTMEVNQNSLARAAHMSREVDQLEYRFRSLDTFQQYPPVNGNKNKQQLGSAASLSSEQTSPITEISNYPAPDYSPNLNRANGKQRSQY